MEEALTKLGEYGPMGLILVVFIIYIWALKKEDTKREDNIQLRLKELDKTNQDNFNRQISINHDAIEKQNAVMEMVAKSNQNVAEALVCLKLTLDNTVVLLREYGTALNSHDERAVQIKNDTAEIKLRVEGCNKRRKGE